MSNRTDGPMGWYVSTALEQAEVKFDKAKADFADAFASNPAYATSWKLAEVLRAQALFEIAAEFTDVNDREQLDRWAERTTRGLAHMRDESKSTSAATNLVEDIKFAVQTRLLGKYYEAIEGEQHIAAGEAKRLAKLTRIGQAVRFKDSPDDRINAGMVMHRREDGFIEVVFTGPEGIGTDITTVSSTDLLVTEHEPYAKVQLVWEDQMDEDQLAEDQLAGEAVAA